MLRFVILLLLFGLLGWSANPLSGEETAIKTNAEAVRAAIRLAIPRLEEGSRVSAQKRKCFTCHSQAMPILALTAAKQHGFEIDDANLQRQVTHTFEHLKSGREKYIAGKGQGGQVLTAGYALEALAAAKYPADEVTSAVVSYLLTYQSDSDHWQHRGNRPPSSGSDFTASYVALRGLHDFGSEEVRLEIELRKETVSKWLMKTNPKETEDHVFRLRASQLLDLPVEVLQQQQAELLALQQTDGGWAQKANLKSDAYATGSVLVVLLQAGADKHSAAIQKGLQYLLSTQHKDGTWQVKTRAKGFQEYYESGFPHAEDQFISIAASSWATWALVLAVAE